MSILGVQLFLLRVGLFGVLILLWVSEVLYVFHYSYGDCTLNMLIVLFIMQMMLSFVLSAGNIVSSLSVISSIISFIEFFTLSKIFQNNEKGENK